jgi:hypothetical protein
MKHIFITIFLLSFVLTSHGQHDEQFIEKHSGIHKVIVNEVLQTSSYTYLRVQDGVKIHWLAVPKIEAEIGEIYYYQGGNEMKDFKSSQLDKTFDSVLFLGGIVNADPLADDKSTSPSNSNKTHNSENSPEIVIEPIEDGITIAELFSKKEEYAGKIVRIKGKVVRFSESIMNKNWIHLQDGTKFNGNFDLVATSDMEFKIDEIIIVEGKITLDKDFGFGYFYEVIMEDCKQIK